MWQPAVWMVLLVSGTKAQISNTRLVDAVGYFTRAAQETLRELEAADWCNLRVPTHYQNYTYENSVTFYDWTVSGEVEYTNGFVVSVASADVLEASVVQTVSDEAASVRGDLRLNHVLTGYDVHARMTDGHHFFTGLFAHLNVVFRLTVSREFGSGELTTSANWMSQQGVSGGRMEYLPSTSLTEVLSRFWFAHSPELGGWATNNIAPALDGVARHRLEFPRLCYNCAA